MTGETWLHWFIILLQQSTYARPTPPKSINQPLWTYPWLTNLFMFRYRIHHTLNIYIKVRKDKVACVFWSFNVPNRWEFVSLFLRRLSWVTMNSFFFPSLSRWPTHITEIHLYALRYVGFHERPWTTHLWAGGHLDNSLRGARGISLCSLLKNPKQKQRKRAYKFSRIQMFITQFFFRW